MDSKMNKKTTTTTKPLTIDEVNIEDLLITLQNRIKTENYLIARMAEGPLDNIELSDPTVAELIIAMLTIAHLNDHVNTDPDDDDELTTVVVGACVDGTMTLEIDTDYDLDDDDDDEELPYGDEPECCGECCCGITCDESPEKPAEEAEAVIVKMPQHVVDALDIFFPGALQRVNKEEFLKDETSQNKISADEKKSNENTEG